MGEPEPLNDSADLEEALFARIQAAAANPATYAQPPLADRYRDLFQKLGLRR